MADPVGDPFQIDKKEQERRVAKNRRAERKPPPPRTGNPYPPPASTTTTVPLLPGTGPTTTPAPPAKTPAKPPAKAPAAKAPAKPPAKTPAKKTTTATGATGPTGATGAIGPANITPTGFSVAVLQEMGIPVTKQAVQALKLCRRARRSGRPGVHGNTAKDFNPFNISGGQSVLNQYNAAQGVSLRTTQDPGNGPPVDEFADWGSGVKATANFLKNADPGMTRTLTALAQPGAGQAEVQAFFDAAQHSGSFGASAGSRISYMNQDPGSLTPITSGTGGPSGATGPAGGPTGPTDLVTTNNNVGTGPPIPPGDVVG